jgi:hypothetical protein
VAPLRAVRHAQPELAYSVLVGSRANLAMLAAGKDLFMIEFLLKDMPSHQNSPGAVG